MMAVRFSTTLFKSVTIATALALLSLTACTTSGPSQPSKPKSVRPGPIQEIHLFGFPVAVNTDHIAGPDTLGIRIFVSSRNAPKGLPIRAGHVEVIMYDAAATSTQSEKPPEILRTWKFSVGDLRANEGQTAIGIGYRLALPLGDAIPKSSGATLVARYVNSKGVAVESSPSTISLLAK